MPTSPTSSTLRLALIGDGHSPHLLKWARALAPKVELWVASSRGFLPGFDGLVPSWRRLALDAQVQAAGGNVALIQRLPELGRWLKQVDADWLHPHYLTSHGTLAWGAKLGWGLRARIVGSAWGSDILVTPQQGLAWRWLTQRVLRACTVCTSDSQHMAGEMRRLGARDVMVFPFGLERMPPPPAQKEPWLFFANRGLEPIYRPDRVLQAFTAMAAGHNEARLVVANDGSLRDEMRQWVASQPELKDRVQFVGRLGEQEQSQWYARANWYLSLPASDSVSVSVLEAMAHGCIPILSDLPANHELISETSIGMILPHGQLPDPAAIQRLAQIGPEIARTNRAWVEQHGLFPPAVDTFLKRLRELTPAPASRPT